MLKDGDLLLSTKELAIFLKISPRSVEGWRLHGGGPCYSKVGRLVRYRIGDVRTWLEERKFENTSQMGG